MNSFRKSPVAWSVTLGLWSLTGVFMLGIGLMELGEIHHDLYCPDHGTRAAEAS